MVPGTFHLAGTAGENNRLIVTAFGKNRVGIVAELTQALARHNCNLEDITQKLLQDYFAMIMIVEMPADASMGTIKEELAGVGNRLGVRILAQHEDVFTTMHRV
ncbi:MAG: ACT domain-containing protein [Candidatus Delongbacteria bacterium]|nr:ACT domain-containing protein [Candidatus Delongbacteria bacterium]